MTDLQVLFSFVSAIALFLFGLEGFSRQIEEAGGERLRQWLARATRNRFAAAAIGAVVTALVQSSSAVTSLTVALVDRGTLVFRSALGVLLGANVGTTTTAFLVSFKLTGVGPVFISIGALLAAIGPRTWRAAGKAVFFFGLVLFTLDLISESLAPVRGDPRITGLLALAEDPWVGVLAGAAITAIVQSSSVTTGLCVVLAQQGVLQAEAAIYVVVGANVGTTVTALVAGAGMGSLARRTAVINTGFNVLGALLFAPVLVIFAAAVVRAAGTPDVAVALAHLMFNAVTAGVLLVAMPLYAGRLEAWATRGLQADPPPGAD